MTRKNECTGSLIETLGKVFPECDPAHIEENLRGTVGGKFCDLAEDDDIDQCREDWLNKKQDRNEDRLLIEGNDVSVLEQNRRSRYRQTSPNLA